MNRIERYLGTAVISYTLLVMLVILLIFSFFEFMNQLGKLTETYTLAMGGLYTLLKVPVYAYQIFPIAILIGALMGLGALANQSELTILRVTGWSIKRILWAVLKTALLLWLVIALIGELVAPSSEALAKKLRAEALNQSFSIGSASGLWIKDEQQYIHVGRIVSSEQLSNISIYQLSANAVSDKPLPGEIEQVMRAKKADYIDDGQWRFTQVQLMHFDQQSSDLLDASTPLYSFQQELLPQLAKSFPLQPEDLTNLDMETRYLSSFDLFYYIRFLEENGLEASAYRLSFWQKLAMPLVVLAMIAIVLPLIFGSMRQVSVGKRIFLGVLIGMGFHLLNQMVGNIAVVYQMPIALAAFLPALLLLLAALWWMRRID
ncbi:LPS export ABC transporter permease LptG [Thiomicrorhabdus sediminis]|uniref:LPS export ABC transporter permease LptG n=1 Tax=Thiomicrorhabdus sediminis TaxID=2580412 RepID=A0A4P9K3S8_9GAMM|nr:LPS export ABC transporter permease LptG [Thiomicrorhabdus sediminis]QCU89584.1 LPS export ABC transporter permease LptG [Thiomicrorhabdus sediminis]